LDTNFFKKIENLFNNKQFESIKFEINSLDEEEKNILTYITSLEL